ncbi:MAG TPA: hypothetical protein ENJ56_01975, partial [Anaerolineae bacterium]|nr:hypothetical protein [Anaerolineae bacterium]
LQRTLEFYDGAEMYRSYVGQLYQFGEVAAGELDQLVRTSNERENLPRLQRFSPLGAQIEQIDYHPSYHAAGRLIYASGAISALEKTGNNMLALALHYLSSQNGEAGHNCPLACTAGVVKSLQALGLSERQEERAAHYLDKLLDPDYDSNFTGAQFLTEVQGGADVGANGSVATEMADGTWRINGRKWFCSNVSADLALVTARVPQQGDGTRGLGLFLVPKVCDDGTNNGLFIERLKEKVGTASLATAEIEYREAVAYPVGKTTRGIQNVMQYVINFSRIYNAAQTAGMARRAYNEAWAYARSRRAFGPKIITYPLVQDGLAKMHTDSVALASGLFHIAKLSDDIELGKDDADIKAVVRTAINLNKYRSSVIAHEVINLGIELLGGNGAIETFSVLPRLLRDNVVCENWEGPHNVLMAQLQRDFRRYAHHLPFIERVRNMFDGLTVRNLKQEGVAACDQISAELTQILTLPELEASVYFRPLMDRLCDLFYTGCMAVEAGWEILIKQDRTKQRMAEFYFNRRVIKKPLAEWNEYPTWVSKLCHDVRPRKIDWDKDRWDGM